MSDGIRVSASVQKAGLLWKTPFGQPSTKWQRRFFVIKDSFILYYSEKEANLFAQDGAYNSHPKGAIPLGGCTASSMSTKEKEYIISISHPDFGDATIALAADTDLERQEWLRWIYDCSRITWKNAQVGNVLAQCLKAKSEVRERQCSESEQFLKVEREALQHERELRDQLLAQIAELESAKQRAIDEAAALRREAARKGQQLDVTITVIEQIEAKKRELEQRAQDLEEELQTSSSRSQAATTALLQQQGELEAATTQLQSNLQTLLDRSQQLEADKRQAQARIAAAEQTSAVLTSELTDLNAVSEQLRIQLKAAQSEREAAEEVVLQAQQQQQQAQSQVEWERLEREKMQLKLVQAEACLERLDKALRDAGVKVAIDFEADVKQLRSFFETVGDEEQWQVHKPQVMKEAVTARPQYKALEKQLESDLVTS